jgi:exonuclease SbcD
MQGRIRGASFATPHPRHFKEIIMRIAHFSDLHFSARNLPESQRCFAAAIDAAIAAHVDVGVISGDSTDHALSAHEPALAALAREVRRLADHCPVFMLQGTVSHEPPGTLAVLALIGGAHPVRMADRIGQIGLRAGAFITPADGLFWDPDVDGPADLVITAVPTVNKAYVVPHAADVGGEYAERLAAVLRDFGVVNDRLYRAGIPTLAVGHGTVDGCVTEHDVPMDGFDHEFSLDRLFSTDADGFALGHIHKHQHWFHQSGTRLQQAAYAGSIGRFHHGEEGDKGFLLWDIAPGRAEFTFVPTPAQRTVDILFAGPPDMEEIARRAMECQGARVRVRYEIDEEHRQFVDRDAIRALLANAADVQIEGKVLSVQRRRAEGVSTEPSLDKRLRMWGEATNIPVDPLLERLPGLHDAPEAVAARVVDALLSEQQV